LYRNALGEHRAGREQEAWQIAQPLFERYPADYAVQDLRCQIAMKRDADWDHARAECEGLMKLSPGFR
jgi:hypothetical protein